MSALCFTLMLLIIIMIPTFLYTLFFLLHRPTTPPKHPHNNPTKDLHHLSVTTPVKFTKDDAKACACECSVCLSPFAEGEELRRLNLCRHLFHKECIEKWVVENYSCPVCRAFVGSKRREVNRPVRFEREDHRGGDLWQGLPDSNSLV